jgi:hypothetical protein
MINPFKHNLTAIIVISTVVFALLIFNAMLNPGNILFSTDDPLGNIVQGKAQMPYCFIGSWSDSPFFGTGFRQLPLSWNSFWLLLLPPTMFKNWFHALNLAGGSIFLALFLRERGLGLSAQMMGALTAFWLGSNLTLVFASHYLKYSTMFLAMLVLWTVPRAVRQRSLAWSVIAGAGIGFMMLEQQDVAIFIGIFLAAFALYEFVRFEGLNFKASAVCFAPMLVSALLISGPAMIASYVTIIGASKDKSTVDVTGGAESPREKWEFTTQWSWPPEESIDFIAPGYMGWRSNEPAGPYWGRMGRSAGWEKTGQGFMNFKLENHYLGAIPVFLALFATCAAMIRKRANDQSIESGVRSEIIFWTCAAVISLLLAFGKFFPLYVLFYQLPLVSSIRNPNKFFHVFQISMGILAAYGLDIIIRNKMYSTLQGSGTAKQEK